jgi:hypothetical protein
LHSVLVALVLAVTSAPAIAEHAKTDIVTTDDGNTFIGELKDVEFGTLVLDMDAAGLLEIEWRRVTSVHSEFQYRVEAAYGVRYFGSLAPSDEPRNLTVNTASGPVIIDFLDVFEILPIEEGFWQRLDGSVNFGLTYTSANEALQYNLGVDATYRTRKNYAVLSAQSIFNTQSGVEDTQQHSGQLFFIQVMKKTWGAFELGALQSNPNQGYDLRLIAGGGATNFFVQNAKRFLALSMGAVYNRENTTGADGTDNSGEAVVGISYRQHKQGSYAPNIHLGLQTFTNFTDTPRYRAVLDFNVSWKIVGDFKFNFQVKNSYDSRPPGIDPEKNDMVIVTSVGYAF